MATENSDNVSFERDEFKYLLPLWKRCRTAVEGEDSVKSEGETYLPRLKGQSDNSYDRYRIRALFYGASTRTVQGMVGALTGKEPSLNPPAGDPDFFDSIVPYTTPIKSFIKQVAEELITVGRVGLLIDAPVDQGTPSLHLYRAESIINWKTRNVEGKEELAQVVLREEVDLGYRFSTEKFIQYRVLFIDGESQNYAQEIWYEDSKKPQDHPDRFILSAAATIPTRGGSPLSFIPFYFINECGTNPTPAKPPLLGLVNVNLSHYRDSADIQHGLHFTALPVVSISGIDSDKEVPDLIIGSESLIATPTGSTISYLEFSGKGLSALRDSLREKEAMMVVLGANLLAAPRAASESADNQRMRRSGENNILANVADSLSEGLTTAIRDLAEWRGIRDFSDINVAVNKESLKAVPNAPLLAQLTAMVQGGLMSEETLHYNLNAHGLIPDGLTFDDEKTLIEEGQYVRPILGLPDRDTATDETDTGTDEESA